MPNDNSRWLLAVLCFGGAGYALLAPWLMTEGSSDAGSHVTAYMQFLTTPWMIGCAAVALVLLAIGLWHLRTLPTRGSEVADIQRVVRRQTIRLTIAWLLVTTALVLIGVVYVLDLREASRDERARQHESIAYLKAQEITKWLSERTADAELLAAALRGLPLDRLSTDRDLRVGVELLFAQLMASSPERVSVSLMAPDGKVLVRTGANPEADSETIKAVKVLASQRPPPRQGIVDIHFNGAPPTPRMDFLVPVVERPGSGSVSAVLAIAINPFDTLMPQVTAWPTPSPTSEVLVIRREGGEVVFITPPKPIRPVPAPLAYKLPLDSNFPTAEAVAKGDGVKFSLSSRGVEVLTASRRVNGMPWVVVAKSELEEIDEALLRKEIKLILMIGAATILAAILMVVLWRGEYARLVAFRSQSRRDLVAATERIALLARQARDIVLLVGPDDRVVEANEAAVKAYGYTPKELLAMTIRDLEASSDEARIAKNWRVVSPTTGALFETVHRRRDGTTFPVEVNARALGTGTKGFRQAFVRDMTCREASRREIAVLSRLQNALQGVTNVLLQARTEGELLRETCGVLVGRGGYRMVSIAAPNQDAGKTVRYLAAAGVEDGYLAEAAITWGDGARALGPTGTALRTGTVQMNGDFASNPAVMPWREKALEGGYRSSIALPLKTGGKTFAALCLYAEQPNAFRKEDESMLLSLAESISYAVGRLREQASRPGP